MTSRRETEAYKWIFSILQVALDCYVWADVDRPRFVEIVGPYKKWGGDNADAFYQYARLDPRRTYKVTCHKGDAVYLSLSVYGGPNDGRYSERIVGTRNDRDVQIDADGRFELWLSPEPHEGNWLQLEPDAVCAITRDYLAEPTRGTRTVWEIEAVDPPPTWRQSEDELATGLRSALTWIRQQSDMVPLTPGAPNTVDDPYPVPSTTFGWAAGDAAYGMGTFELDRHPGAGAARTVARLRVLEPLPLEPLPAHLQLRLRARDDQREPGAVRSGRVLDDRRRRRSRGPPQRVVDPGSSRRAALVPVVPARPHPAPDRDLGDPGGRGRRPGPADVGSRCPARRAAP